MRRIAERVEYSPAAIYLHFKDKSELILQICQQTFHELDQRLEAHAQKGMPPLEGFLKGCEEYIRFGLEHPSHYIVTLCTPEDRAAEPVGCFPTVFASKVEEVPPLLDRIDHRNPFDLRRPWRGGGEERRVTSPSQDDARVCSAFGRHQAGRLEQHTIRASQPGITMRNSFPPKRPSESPGRQTERRRRAVSRSTASPTRGPCR